MTAEPSSLEIHFHLADGKVARFRQDDAAEIQRLLALIHPSKVFTQGHITVAGSYSLNAFHCNALTRIDLVMDTDPGWGFLRGVTDVVEVTEAEVRERRVARGERTVTPGETILAHAEIELSSGQAVFLEVHVQPQQQTALDVAMMVQQLFGLPSLYGWRRGGGVFLVNPVHVVRFSLFPGPPHTPPGAWPAHYVTE